LIVHKLVSFGDERAATAEACQHPSELETENVEKEVDVARKVLVPGHAAFAESVVGGEVGFLPKAAAVVSVAAASGASTHSGKGTSSTLPHVLGGTHPLCSWPSRHLLQRAAHQEGTSSFCFFWCFLVHTLYTLVNIFSSGYFIPLCLCD